MPQPSGSEGLWAALCMVGALLLALGLGELLLGGRGKASPPDWWGRLDDPVPEPDPALSYAGSTRLVTPGRAAGPTADGGGGSIGPENLGPPRFPLRSDAGPGLPPHPGEGGGVPFAPLEPATRWQAVILTPAGQWGSYWQTAGRCLHSHATPEQAWQCGMSTERPAGAIVAAELEE